MLKLIRFKVSSKRSPLFCSSENSHLSVQLLFSDELLLISSKSFISTELLFFFFASSHLDHRSKKKKKRTNQKLLWSFFHAKLVLARRTGFMSGISDPSEAEDGPLAPLIYSLCSVRIYISLSISLHDTLSGDRWRAPACMLCIPDLEFFWEGFD